MHEGLQHYTYLRSHDKTFPASNSDIDIAVKKQPLYWFLTMLNSKDSSVKAKLDRVDFGELFEPHVFHSGLAQIVKYFGRPKVKSVAKYTTVKGEFILTDELPKNNLISIALQCLLGQDYFVGSLRQYMTDLDMPSGNYSLFGRSRNDSFIMHKDKYHVPCKDGKIAIGIYKALYLDEEIVCVDLNGGVVEYKNDYYATQQLYKEMITTAGNLLALSLIDGNQVNEIDIFGLGLNYDQSAANLVHLNVNFTSNTYDFSVSGKYTDLRTAFEWLLCLL